MSFVSELKRRKVFQVAAVYLVVAWLIMQVVDVVNEPLLLPDWFARVVILLLAVGFPIAVITSWAFDVTPEGVVRDRGTGVAIQSGGRRMNFVLIGLLVVAIGWIGFREFNPPEADDRLPNSVAVLPFENLSPDPNNAYFADGIHESTLNQLTKILNLSVIARTSVLQYANDRPPIPEIAEALNVEMVMEGSVRYANDRVLITAQLIDGQTGIHLWSDEYVGDLVDIFAVQAEIAENIAMALEVEVLASERESINRPLSDSAQATAFYLSGIGSAGNIAPGGIGLMAELHDYLDQAIEYDQEFARAYAVKALDYGQSLFRPFPISDALTIAERERLAQENAGKALEIDPTLGVAHLGLGWIDFFNRRWEEARRHFERALELSPNDRDVLIDSSVLYSTIGQYDEAVSLERRLAEVDPVYAPFRLGVAQWRAGNQEAAAVALREAIALGINAHLQLSLVELARKDNAAALEQLRLSEEFSPSDPEILARLVYVYGRLGRREDAMRHFNELEALATVYGIGEALFAQANLGLGDYDRTLELLLDALGKATTHGYVLASIEHNWFDDPALERPEFVEVRSRLGFRE